MTGTAITSPIPEPPPDFNGDARGKWFETWRRLDHARFDLARDFDVLVEYCEKYAQWRQAKRDLGKLSALVDAGVDEVVVERGRKGEKTKRTIRLSGLKEQRDAAAERMLVLAEQLGLSPVNAKPRGVSWAKEILPAIMEGEEDEPTAEGGIGIGRPLFWTVERVLPCLQAARGSPSATAALLRRQYPGRKCAPRTIRQLLQDHPELKRVADEMRQSGLEQFDFDEMEAAAFGDVSARRFILSRQHPLYRPKQEISGPFGGPIQVEHEMVARPADVIFEGLDANLLTDDEKIELSGIAELIDRKGSIAYLTPEQFVRMQALQGKARPKSINNEGAH